MSAGRTEKGVFISYRRTNVSWALAVYHALSSRGYDVFLDLESIASGDFERVIIESIKARAHFLLVLTPSALERCADNRDQLRREIETAIASKRNIVPLILEGFDFATPTIANQLHGSLATLGKYNALRVVPDYFPEAMTRLCSRFLDVSLDTVLHPPSSATEQAVRRHQIVASQAEEVGATKLRAEEKFEEAFSFPDDDLTGQIRCYTEAIRLNPAMAHAHFNRGRARAVSNDLNGAEGDYTEALRLRPDWALAFYARARVRECKVEAAGLLARLHLTDESRALRAHALADYDEALRLDPDLAIAYFARGESRKGIGDREGAVRDYTEAIRCDLGLTDAYVARGCERLVDGDIDGAIEDCSNAIHAAPDRAEAYRWRGEAWRRRGDARAALLDLWKHVKLVGSGHVDGDVVRAIRELKSSAR